jgi:hypothetical protein
MENNLIEPAEAPDTYRTPNSAPVGLPAHESDDLYPTIALLGPALRVINCRDNMQWIVQRRENSGGKGWRGLSFCCTRDALIRDAKRRLGGPIPADALAILRSLPEWHPDRGGR